jgi:hypothetical protein
MKICKEPLALVLCGFWALNARSVMALVVMDEGGWPCLDYVHHMSYPRSNQPQTAEEGATCGNRSVQGGLALKQHYPESS